MGTPPVDEPGHDAEILEGCRRGDPEAQRRAFERYRDRVYAVAVRFLKGDEAAAHDVTQEVFVKMFRAAPGFRGEARLSTWLHRIAVNACMDELRRRRRLLFFGDLPDAIHPTTSPDGAPSALRTEVVAAVDRLPARMRITVLLRYFEDLPYDEIARALQCTTGTVASRLHRAHAILARELAHLGPAAAGLKELSHDTTA
jgi:RNA polymerase sigma-70 factor (ECF subfamily)